MRVAFDGRSLASAVLRGWDRYTVGLVGELVRQGIDVTLFHRECEPLCRTHIEHLGCHVLSVPDRGGLYWEQVSVPLALWRGKYELFHAPAEHGVPFVAPCPVVLTIHSVTTHSYANLVEQGLLPGKVQDYLGYEPESKWKPAPFYLRAQWARADHVFTPSDFARSEVIKFLGIRPDRVTATPLAVHEQFKRPPTLKEERTKRLQKLGVNKRYLLYVGGYEIHKNVHGLIEVFARVRQLHGDISLVLVGTKAVPDHLRLLARQLGLTVNEDVTFLVDLRDELTDLYDGCELFVSMSWRETFCLPALEAVTRGINVVASEWGATRDIIGDAGEFVDPRDPEGAAKLILHRLTCPKSSTGARGHHTSQRFSWSETAQTTHRIYESLVCGY